MSEISWFRPPKGDAGTLNACYNALDRHVIRGRAEDVAWTDPGSSPDADRSFARLLSEVAACAGVLRAFGVGVGGIVSIGTLPRETGVVVALAAARVGALTSYDDSAGADVTVRVAEGEDGVVLTADAEELPWAVAMRAGRTDPAPCAEIPGDATLARCGEHTLTVLDALGAAEHQLPPLPPAATHVDVGGLMFWSFDASS